MLSVGDAAVSALEAVRTAADIDALMSATAPAERAVGALLLAVARVDTDPVTRAPELWACDGALARAWTALARAVETVDAFSRRRDPRWWWAAARLRPLMAAVGETGSQVCEAPACMVAETARTAASGPPERP